MDVMFDNMSIILCLHEKKKYISIGFLKFPGHPEPESEPHSSAWQANGKEAPKPHFLRQFKVV